MSETPNIAAFSMPFPGVTEWLRHGQALGYWSLNHIRPQVEVNLPEADTYLVGAWHPAYRDIVDFLANKHEKRIIVGWSSSAMEIESAGVEVKFLHQLTTSPVGDWIDSVGCLHPGLVDYFPNGFHLPAPIHVPDTTYGAPWSERHGIGLYAPLSLKKNFLTQLLAVKYLQDDHDGRPVLHTNLTEYEEVLDHLGVTYEMEDWVDREDHLTRLGQRKVILSASHGESWCYGVTDALLADTPVVASPTVHAAPPAWRVSNPNHPHDVLNLLRSHLDQEDAGNISPRDYVEKQAWEQNQAVERVLQHLHA